MASQFFLWDEEADGNVEHLAEHGLTPNDVEHALRDRIQAHEKPVQ